jgi:uncharacterized protein (DUF697 family)
MCRNCVSCQRQGQRFCSSCGSRLTPSAGDDVTSGLVGAVVGAATDSSLLGIAAGTLVGGSLIGGLLGGIAGDLLDGSLDD